MPSNSPQSSQPNKKLKPNSSSSRKLKTVKLSSSQPIESKKLKPLSSALKTPNFDLSVQKSSKRDVKGKSKVDYTDDRLWVDIYEPHTEAELAVHKKKVEDVRRWFTEAFDGGPLGKLKKYRRILALTGPAGTAKTATVRILSRELGFEILEWRNSMSENFSKDDHIEDGFYMPLDQEALFTKFQAFLTRASSCQSIFSSASTSAASQSSSSSASSSLPRKPPRKVILLEDLPNILHPKIQDHFHMSLQSLVDSDLPGAAPIVIIVSDAGVRGEAMDERISAGGTGGGTGSSGKDSDVIDIRSVLPSGLLHSVYVTQIGFNPIAPTLMRKALQSLLAEHFSSPSPRRHPSQPTQQPSKEFLDMIIASSNGDIRSAVMALQFACVVRLPSNKKGKNKSRGDTKVVLEAVTRREQSLHLFHLMGKVLYNKRKGDPPNASATAKDIQREKEFDEKLLDPPPLPSHLAQHGRPTSRVDVDAIYADSPIDSSLFSLYIQQNYTQFCNDVDECDGIAHWLSWVDSSGGDSWHQGNPHRFHLLTLGTLHSLPTPVERRNQKFFKPEFFDNLKKQKEVDDAIVDTRRWLTDATLEIGMLEPRDPAPVAGWSRAEIATEIGGVLKARDTQNRGHVDHGIPPPVHRTFSSLLFTRRGPDSGVVLDDGDDGIFLEGGAAEFDDEADLNDRRRDTKEADRRGGWLEDDVIEDFE